VTVSRAGASRDTLMLGHINVVGAVMMETGQPCERLGLVRSSYIMFNDVTLEDTG